jgi:hypothetical protein
MAPFQVVNSLSTNSSTSHLPYTILTVMRPLNLSQVQGFAATSKFVQLQRAPGMSRAVSSNSIGGPILTSSRKKAKR